MKVLIHAPDLQTLGGKQSYFLAVKDHFREDVDFFTYGSRGKKESVMYTIRRMLKDYMDFYRLLGKEKYDVVHLNPSLNRNSFFRDCLFSLIANIRRSKVLAFWHGWNRDFEKAAFSRYMPLFKGTYAKSDVMIILANEFKEKLRNIDMEQPIFQETTVVDDYLLNGLDEETILARQANPKELRLLFLARVERAKGIYEAVDAFAILQKKYPHLRLDVAGTGGEYEPVQQYVKDRGIEGIQFLGFINGQDKVDTFHRSHIYLFPSIYGEGLPCSVLESMGCGLPVITTANAGIRDFFQPEQMGAFIEEQSGEHLAEKIEPYIVDHDLRCQVAKYNYHYTQEHFKAPIVAGRLEAIYEKVAQS